jgi:hypothetical protein
MHSIGTIEEGRWKWPRRTCKGLPVADDGSQVEMKLAQKQMKRDM